ncbi:MAG: histidine kinase [Gemmatimonadota bacterium]
MDLSVPQLAATELAAAYFQFIVTVALALLAARLYQRYRKSYFRDWAVAWGIYAVRLGAIVVFLHTAIPVWLYWHQVLTGWTALALLWAALSFAREIRWRPVYWLLVLFPPIWSYAAIYQMDNFLLAAGPAVLFLSAATLATAWAFFRYHREASSAAARLLAFFLVFWALHHLDYPFLRARGIWNPWGYYLDVLFELAVGGGILLLVQEDLDEGLRALSALSAELQSGRPREELPQALIDQVLALRAVRGGALFWSPSAEGASRPPGDWLEAGTIVAAGGACRSWQDENPGPGLARLLEPVATVGEPRVRREASSAEIPHAYVAALPILQRQRVSGALVVVGEARDPFTALDDSFLLTLGQQIGAALRNAELNRSLADRTRQLERLQEQMVQRHEEERDRISRELHDETAQVLAAVNMRLGLLQELVRDLSGRGGLQVEARLPEQLPELSPAAELAMYRAVQEGLANVARHAEAEHAVLSVSASSGGVLTLTIQDDGRGFPQRVLSGELRHSSGLMGMRERIAAVGGEVALGTSPAGGASIQVKLHTRGESRSA